MFCHFCGLDNVHVLLVFKACLQGGLGFVLIYHSHVEWPCLLLIFGEIVYIWQEVINALLWSAKTHNRTKA